MKNKNIIAFDILGPLYNYDGKKGWISGTTAVETLIKKLENLGYDTSTETNAALSESQMIRKKEAEIYINPGFVESVLYIHKKGGLPIIFSAGSFSAFELVLEKAVKDYYKRTGELIKPNNLFAEEHRHSTVGVGSKKDPVTWKEILSIVYGSSSRVLLTYEDTFANMQAAMKASNCMGFHVVAQKNGIYRVAPKIYRGTMQELLPQLKEVM